MNNSDASDELAHPAGAMRRAVGLAPARLHFLGAVDLAAFGAAVNFTRLLVRFNLAKNKSTAVAWLYLREFKTAADYIATVKKKEVAGAIKTATNPQRYAQHRRSVVGL